MSLQATCVHDNGREHPSDGTLPCPLVAAVETAYDARGVSLWWQAWDTADESRRRHMEDMILGDGMG